MLALLTALAGAADPALAHHSFAMFDNTRTETITGTVYTFEWSNPHAWLWIDVDDGKGNDVKWGFEAAAPSEMSRSGWNKRILTPGEKVTVEYRPLKDGRPGGSLGKVTKSDGTVIGGCWSRSSWGSWWSGRPRSSGWSAFWFSACAQRQIGVDWPVHGAACTAVPVSGYNRRDVFSHGETPS
jgi:hypothetical protein